MKDKIIRLFQSTTKLDIVVAINLLSEHFTKEEIAQIIADKGILPHYHLDSFHYFYIEEDMYTWIGNRINLFRGDRDLVIESIEDLGGELKFK